MAISSATDWPHLGQSFMGTSSPENGLWLILTYCRSAIMERQTFIYSYILSFIDAIVEIQKTHLVIRQEGQESVSDLFMAAGVEKQI